MVFDELVEMPLLSARSWHISFEFLLIYTPWRPCSAKLSFWWNQLASSCWPSESFDMGTLKSDYENHQNSACNRSAKRFQSEMAAECCWISCPILSASLLSCLFSHVSSRSSIQPNYEAKFFTSWISEGVQKGSLNIYGLVKSCERVNQCTNLYGPLLETSWNTIAKGLRDGHPLRCLWVHQETSTNE